MKNHTIIRTGCVSGALIAFASTFVGFKAIGETNACIFEDQSTPRAIQLLTESCRQVTSDKEFEGRVEALLDQYDNSPNVAISEESLTRIKLEFAAARSVIPTQLLGLGHGAASFVLIIPLFFAALLLAIALNVNDIWRNPPSNMRTLSVARQVYRED